MLAPARRPAQRQLLRLLDKSIKPRTSIASPTNRIVRRTLATSTNRAASWMQSNSRISTIFTILMGVGVASTTYGVYQFYTTFTMWPPEVRGDLRAGIKAKNQGDLDLSERYLRRAWATAQTLPLSAFSTEPHLKLSGIAIALAEVQESANRPSDAYETYSTALAQLRAAESKLSGRERMRAVALAHKLGEMAEVYQRGAEETEHFLTFAVEEALRVVTEDGAAAAAKGKQRDGDGAAEGEAGMMLAELELPWWVRKVDVAAPLEALGRFYAGEGKPEYSTTLYLQAIGMLMQPPPGKTDAAVEDRCRAAQIMNNLSDLMVRDPQPSNLHSAEAWARQAQGVIEKTRSLPRTAGNEEGMALCEQTLAAVLFNLGALLEMGGKHDAAKKSFQDSLEQAKRIGLRSGAMEARGALRRLERAGRSSSSTDQDPRMPVVQARPSA